MRSGNKVSFKNMGSSPAKQSDEEIGLDTPEAKAIKERDLEKSKNKDLQATIDALKSNKDVGSERDKRILSGKATDEDRAKQAASWKASNERAEKAPWSQQTKEKYGTMYKKDKDGLLTEDAKEAAKDNLSRRELIALKRQDKENARKGDGKITKEERYKINQDNLQRKYKKAQATGGMGVKFNWKNAFTGRGLAGMFDVAPRRDILADKIVRKDKRKTQKENRKATNKETRRLREERKPGTVFSRAYKKIMKK